MAIQGFNTKYQCQPTLFPTSTIYTTGVGAHQQFKIEVNSSDRTYTFNFISCPGLESTEFFFKKFYQITTAQYYFCLQCKQSFSSEDQRKVRQLDRKLHMETRFVEPLTETDLEPGSIWNLLRFQYHSSKAVPSGFKEELSLFISRVFVSKTCSGGQRQANRYPLR